MTKPTNRRWVCPEEEHPGVLAPTRLRKIDVRRYCLPCSEAAGVLIERACPSAAREKSRRAETVRRKRARAPTRQQRLQKARIRARIRAQTRFDREHAAGIYIPRHFHQMIQLPVVAEALEKLERPRPTVVVRRRKGKHTSGHARVASGRVVLTVPHACTWGQLATIVAHEIAHVCVADEEWHGAAWRTMFLAILQEGYGLRTGWPTRSGRGVPYSDAHIDFEKMIDGGVARSAPTT